MKNIISLIDLEKGSGGKIISISGGRHLRRKLECLGVRPGVYIRKVTAHFGQGPVTIQVGKTQVALGFGMAQKITLELQDEEDNLSG